MFGGTAYWSKDDLKALDNFILKAKQLGSVGPGSSLHKKFIARFFAPLLSVEERYDKTNWRNALFGYTFGMRATLVYKDAFRETHDVNWCWDAFVSGDIPTDCDAQTN